MGQGDGEIADHMCGNAPLRSRDPKVLISRLYAIGVDVALRLVWQFPPVMTRILHVLDHSLPAHSGYTFRTRALMKAQAAKGWAVAGVTGVRQPEQNGRAACRERGCQSV